jgi:hypothetical protein
VWGVPGTLVTRRALAEYNYLDDRSYLKTPRIFGFHGVYKRLAIHLGLVDVHLGPRTEAERLVDAWARDAGHGGLSGCRPLLSKWRHAIERSLNNEPARTRPGWQSDDWAELAEVVAPHRAKAREKRYLRDALHAADDRALGALPTIWRLQEGFTEEDFAEEPLHERLAEQSPGYGTLLEAIRAYERFCRGLHDGFDLLRAEAAAADATGESWTTLTENGLVGYKDAAGKVVIPAQFAFAREFSQGIARVREREKDLDAFIDTTGKLITPSKYSGGDWVVRYGLVRVGAYGDDITRALMNGERLDYTVSENGKTTVYMKSGKTFNYSHMEGFIDTTGKEVIPLKFDEANSFVDGMAAVYQYQGRWGGQDAYKVGWIDTTGKMVIPYMSGGSTNYDWSVFNFKDGLVCYFVETDKDPDTLPAAGIMDKTGKIIIPANKDEWFHSYSFGLQWRDGVIAVTPDKEVNAKGVPTKGGGYEWSFSAIYDYSGKLIKNLEGYVYAMPIGSGFTMALHQLPDGALVDVLDTQMNEGYWSVFDRYGNMVVDKAEKNNFYLINSPYGYDNGYIYLGDSRYEITLTPAPTPTPAPTDTLTATAKPTDTQFMLNGAEASLPAYLINENNYVKLRDVAALLKTRFEVKWEDGKAKLYNKTNYTIVGGELAATKAGNQTAKLSNTDFVWGDSGAAVTGLTAYLISGNNYIKLRDIAKLFDFDVDWRDGKAWIEPDVSPYTED